MKTKKLPKRVLVKWHTEGNDEPWLEVGEKMADLSEYNDTIEAGLYVLEKEIKIKNQTILG